MSPAACCRPRRAARLLQQRGPAAPGAPRPTHGIQARLRLSGDARRRRGRRLLRRSAWPIRTAGWRTSIRRNWPPGSPRKNQLVQGYLADAPGRAADQAAPRGAVELRALRRPAGARRALLLHPQRRPAEPGVLYVAGPRWTPSRGCCSIRTRSRPDGTVALAGLVSSATTASCWPTRCPTAGSRLAGVAGARRRHRPGPARRDQVGQVHRRRLAPTAAGFFYSRYDEPQRERDARRR